MATTSSSRITLQEPWSWDEILDHLYDAPVDLKSLASVCRAFRSRAQTQLFRVVKVDCERSRPWHSPSSRPGSRCHQSMSATRLTQLLLDAPHLIDYIRDLYIGNCSLQTLTAMEQIAWSRLHAIFFVGNQGQDCQQPEVLALISSLVSLPTVRKLAFHSMFWESAHLYTLVSRCTPELHSLTFESCFLPTTPYDVPTATATSLPLITSLVLFSVEGNFSNYSALPVDFSRLAHITLYQNTIPALETLLYSCRRTIQSLHLNGSEPYVATLDLGAFPALSHLTLSGVGTSLQRAFERSWVSTLQTISYRLLWVGWEGNLRQLDTMLAGAVGKMPALRRVEVAIFVSGMGKGRGPQSEEEWRRLIGEKMPRLAGREILVIAVVTDEEE
ncbi:hypothetical protein K438DRAFT_1964977 [Mycena galopus ATCC 62051]|nr:hypothetical protein K438DRAFT_1964977 [Mycena galopus ATCC 62051]